MLWHGEPGTGKTHALRALGRAWNDWCSTHFITDPEAFLGSGTSYLLDVLSDVGDGRDAFQNARWKLVVLEDAGELLADAHERTGQALSRLLNVTDGVLGQGMKTIVLVTTNEPLGRIHPAIQRPGRCWREMEFAPLDVASASRWLAARDSQIHIGVATPLADLFAIVRGHEVKKEAPWVRCGVSVALCSRCWVVRTDGSRLDRACHRGATSRHPTPVLGLRTDARTAPHPPPGSGLGTSSTCTSGRLGHATDD